MDIETWRDVNDLRGRVQTVTAQRDELLVVLQDITRQLECLGHKLVVRGPPGHADYISKVSAAKWIQVLCTSAAAAIAKAEGK